MTGNGSTPPSPAPTVESLQAELARARQLIQLFRQQRDQAATLCNDLQVELAMTRQDLAEAKPALERIRDGDEARQELGLAPIDEDRP